MRIKVDEDLPHAVAELLRRVGHADTLSVLEQKMQGWKDGPLWDVLQEEGRFLVTADKGFADIRAHPPGSHAGVLLLRPDTDGIAPLLDLLGQVLARTDLPALAGSITVATTQGLRVRRPATLSDTP